MYCDLVNKSLYGISALATLAPRFHKKKILQLPDFILDSTRKRIVESIVKNSESRIYNQNSLVDSLAQLDSIMENKNKDTIKQHAILDGKHIQEQLPELHFYYHNCLPEYVSAMINRKVYSINENGTMNNSIILYENENDSIRWHTDKSMFNDKKVVTLLLYLLNESTQELCYIENDTSPGDSNNEPTILCGRTEENSGILLEHFVLKHYVSPLKKGEKRIVWSMTFAEDMNLPTLSSYTKNKVKNISYLGLRAINATDVLVVIVIILIILVIVLVVGWRRINKTKKKDKKRRKN